MTIIAIIIKLKVSESKVQTLMINLILEDKI